MGLPELFRKSKPLPVEYMEATRRSRLRFLALVAILAPIYFGAAPVTRWMLAQGEAQADLCGQLVWLRALVVLYAFFLLCAAALLGWQFQRIWVRQQMPLPDAPILFRSRILRGWRARAHAIPLLVFALGIVGGVISLASTDVAVTLMFSDCTPGDPPTRRRELAGQPDGNPS